MIKPKGRFFSTASFVVAILFVFLFAAKGAIAKTNEVDSQTKTKAAETYGKLPLLFIANNGQTDKSVRFYERGSGHATFFTAEGVYISLNRAKKKEAGGQDMKGKRGIPSPEKSRPLSYESSLVKLIPLHANPSPQIIAEAPQEGKVNYFIGNDPKKWKTNIPTYGAVVYKDLYKGIDIKFYGNNRQLEYDIIVSPGADPSQVKLSYEGITGLKATKNGDLEISLKEGNIIQRSPQIYQEIDGRKVGVAGRFKIENPTTFSYGFEVASYNKDYTLIIDPVVVYSTYLGGSGGNYGGDSGNGIAVDGSGNAYVTGYTFSTDFPTLNPSQGEYKGGYYGNVFVTKINAAGTSLVYSTYLGGSGGNYGGDSGNGVAVDGSGNAYVTGQTSSTDFPTLNPLQGGFRGFSDAFVTKINAEGNALEYSTYLGGSFGGDSGNAIAVDGSGNAYVTGKTFSTTFPTLNPIQGTLAGDYSNAFVTKINAAGTSLVYSTYLGGSSNGYGWDSGNGIAVDGSGNAYVTGQTYSTTFPTLNPIQGTYKGGDHGNAFVTKINAAGTSLVYSTYLGGSLNGDSGNGIAVDGSGNAYVTGQTRSTDFPTLNPIQGGLAGIYGNAFVTKINAAGNALVYSTYLGGISYDGDSGNGIAVDGSGNAYVTGYTFSTDFPTLNSTQGALAGAHGNAFVTKINAAGNALVYSTYLGGSGGCHVDIFYVYCNGDSGNGIAVDGSGNAYVTGQTYSSDFPTLNPIQGGLRGSSNAFVTKIGDLTPFQITLTITKTGTGSGTVTSSPSGINCGPNCSATFNSGSVIILKASPDSGSSFAGWGGGGGSGTGTCTTILNADTTVWGRFDSKCAATMSDDFLTIHVPIALYGSKYYTADMTNTKDVDYVITSIRQLTDTSSYTGCLSSAPVVTPDLVLEVPVLIWEGYSYWSDFVYAGNRTLTWLYAGPN